jgi:hypothetical protein
MSATAFEDIVPEVEQPPAERRRALRVEYDALIAVADYDGLHPPHVYREALAKDLSDTGIAFFADQPPAFEQMVAVLALGNRTLSVAMRVVRFEAGNWHRRPQFLIGCEFIERV